MIRNVRLNDVVKKVGSTIIANPSEEPAETLTKVNIDGVVYEIQSGSGEGLVSVSKEMTFADNEFGFDVVTQFTEEEFSKLYGEKCDLYLFIRQDDGEGTFIMQGFSFNKFLTQDINGELTVAYYLDMDATNRVGLVISLTNGVIQHEFSVEGDTGGRFIQLSATAEDWSDLTIENGAIESMYENLAAMVEVGSNQYYSTNITIDNTTAVIDFILTPTNHRIVTLTRPSEYEDFDTIANVVEEITLVEANSGEETTETLTTLKIGTTNYALESGGSEIVDINNLRVIPTDYQDINKLKNVILFKNDLYYELTYADSDYLYYTNTYELAYNRISVSLIDYSINQADTINVDRVFGVEITDVPSAATNGTLTEEQLATLQASDSNYILFNNEKYYLNDKGHTEGYLTYSHLGAASEEIIAKTITITISTRAWVLLEEQVGGGSGGGIIELEELPSVVDESSPNLVNVNSELYMKTNPITLGTWVFNDIIEFNNNKTIAFCIDFISNEIEFIAMKIEFNNNNVYSISYKQKSTGGWNIYYKAYNNIYWSSKEQFKTITTTSGLDLNRNKLVEFLSTAATKNEEQSKSYYYKKVSGKEIIYDKDWNGVVPIEYRNIERLKNIVFIRYESSRKWEAYTFGKVSDDSSEQVYFYPQGVLKLTTFASNSYVPVEVYIPMIYFSLKTGAISDSSSSKVMSLFRFYSEPSLGYTGELIKNCVKAIGFTADGWTEKILPIAAQGVDFNTLLSITAEATSGTITSDMLEVLQLSEENYIVFNNQIYRLQDNENDSGVLTYTYVGHSADIVSKTITITISTLAWTLSTISITAEITGALQGDY